MSELDTMISQAKQIDQLRAELQAERTEAIAAMKLGEALTQLETAQATIARQRDEISKFRTMFWHAENLLAVELCDKALAQPANQDALHEALAKESEECADIAGDLATKLWLADRAAAHRARKEGK